MNPWSALLNGGMLAQGKSGGNEEDGREPVANFQEGGDGAKMRGMSRKTADKSEVYTTTVSSRGQVVLPSPVRRKLGLRKGTRISIVLGQGNKKSIVLRPMETNVIRELRGILKGAGEALDFLQEERRRDRERGR